MCCMYNAVTVRKIIVSTILLARKYKRAILGCIGVATVGEIFREYLRAKLMDWAVEHFGNFGQWLLDFPFAVITITLACLFICLATVAIFEAVNVKLSPIVDLHGGAFETTKVPKEWAMGFSAAMVIFAVLLAFGTLRYYRLVSSPEINIMGLYVSSSNRPYANVFYENIGGTGTVTIHTTYEMVLADGAKPWEIGKDLVYGENQRVPFDSQDFTFSIKPLNKHYFTVLGAPLTPEQIKDAKEGKVLFFFGGTILTTGKTSKKFYFCNFVASNKPNVILRCPGV
jgi:hypothetical protein